MVSQMGAIRQGRDAETVSRLWVYDSNLLVEPNGSGLCRSFNPYVKPPVSLGRRLV